MSFIKNNLSANEEIVLKAKIHWFIFAPGTVMILLGLAFMPMSRFKAIWDWTAYYGIIALWENIHSILTDDWLVALCAALITIGTGEFIRSFIRKYSVGMGITNQRVIKKYGLATTATEEIYLHNISSIEIAQTFFGRIFNFGWVYFESPIYGTTIFPMVSNPSIVRRAALQETEKLKVFSG